MRALKSSTPFKLENKLPLNQLTDDIRSGKIKFWRGEFTGEFSARTSKELRSLGAKWDRQKKSYRLLSKYIPVDIRSAVAVSESRMEKTVQRIEKVIDDIIPAKIAESINIEPLLEKTLFKVDADLKKTLRGISITPEISETAKKKIMSDYNLNMQKYIKDWTEKEIIKLRKNVSHRGKVGFRFESLAKEIEYSYGVSRRKAKFLARQETSLFMSKIRQTRYQDAGVNSYIWTTVKGSAEHPVRDMHKALDGKEFNWDNPPVTDNRGNRNHPGEDFNCRCFARPVVKF